MTIRISSHAVICPGPLTGIMSGGTKYILQI